jgi:hypothetical protein
MFQIFSLMVLDVLKIAPRKDETVGFMLASSTSGLSFRLPDDDLVTVPHPTHILDFDEIFPAEFASASTL